MVEAFSALTALIAGLVLGAILCRFIFKPYEGGI